jgi:hypothetical protein
VPEEHALTLQQADQARTDFTALETSRSPSPVPSLRIWHNIRGRQSRIEGMRLSPHPIDDANARAVTWLTAWDSQGSHRTGTTGDDAGARWLEHEAAALGAEVANEVFTLDRLDPVAC